MGEESRGEERDEREEGVTLTLRRSGAAIGWFDVSHVVHRDSLSLHCLKQQGENEWIHGCMNAVHYKFTSWWCVIEEG